MMCWNGNPIFDCEAEFRFYWLHTQLPQVPVKEVALANEAKVEILPRFTGQAFQELEQACQAADTQGLYMYDKKGHYSSGQVSTQLTYISKHQFSLLFLNNRNIV